MGPKGSRHTEERCRAPSQSKTHIQACTQAIYKLWTSDMMILCIRRASSALPACSAQFSALRAQKLQKKNHLYANTKNKSVLPNKGYLYVM